MENQILEEEIGNKKGIPYRVGIPVAIGGGMGFSGRNTSEL